MRILVLAIIALILISLGSALFFLVRDKGQSTRTVKALAVRVALSLALFLLLMLGYKLGFIPGRLT
jgi:formate/nitrite transporter FocA (FNT family)